MSLCKERRLFDFGISLFLNFFCNIIFFEYQFFYMKKGLVFVNQVYSGCEGINYFLIVM